MPETPDLTERARVEAEAGASDAEREVLRRFLSGEVVPSHIDFNEALWGACTAMLMLRAQQSAAAERVSVSAEAVAEAFEQHLAAVEPYSADLDAAHAFLKALGIAALPPQTHRMPPRSDQDGSVGTDGRNGEPE